MANNNTELKGWAKYCKEQNIEFSTNRIFIDGLGGMAHGLFASLLIGCIINTIGMYVPLLKDIVVNPWGSEALAGANLLIASKTAAYAVQGAAMAAAIAYSMKAPPFVMYSARRADLSPCSSLSSLPCSSASWSRSAPRSTSS